MAKLAKKDINLMELMAGPKQKPVRTGFLLVVGGIGLAALMVVGFISTKLYVSTLDGKVSDLQAKTQDPVLLEKLANLNEVMEQINVMRSSGDVYKQVRLEIMQSQSYCDDLTNEFIDTLNTSETILTAGEALQLADITSLDYSNGSVNISAVSADNRSISNFMDRLNGLELFSAITYNGYTGASSKESEAGSYSFTADAFFFPHEYELPSEDEQNADSSAEQQTEETQEGE